MKRKMSEMKMNIFLTQNNNNNNNNDNNNNNNNNNNILTQLLSDHKTCERKLNLITETISHR